MAMALAMVPIGTPSSSSVNLIHHHVKEVLVSAMKVAEVEESSNRHERVHSRPTNNRPPSPAFMSPILYSATVSRRTSRTSLSPGSVSLTIIPVKGLSREDAITAIMPFHLGMDLHSSSQLVVGFCFLVPAESSDMSYVGRISDHNLPPRDHVSALELVRKVKSRNISKFTGAVCSYLTKNGSPEEYMKNKSSITEAQLWNLDSVRIWNMLSLSRGGEIEKELVDEGLIEALIRVEDLPSPLQLIVAPPHDYKPATSWLNELPDFDSDNELSDARNNDVTADEEGRRSVANRMNFAIPQDHKRKAVAAMSDDPCPYDDLQIKKPRHGGALRIVEPEAPIHEAEAAQDSSA